MALSKLTKVQTLGIGSNIEVVGVITTGQFKSGTSNLHSSGVELTNLNVSGIATIGGNVSIGGTLTYQDVTNIDSVGLITARSGINVSGGTATFAGDLSIADKIIHTGDTNTAIRFPSADTITAETGGTERLRITSTGEVKIMNTSGTVGLYFQSSSGAVSNFRAIGTNNQSLGYFFGNSERVRFSSDGKVGIGDNTPENKLKITVTSGNDGIVVQNTSTANIALIGARNGDATLQIGQYGSTASGNVFGVAAANLAFMYTTSYASTHPSALLIGNSSNKDIIFATNSTERLRITSDGDVNVATGHLQAQDLKLGLLADRHPIIQRAVASSGSQSLSITGGSGYSDHTGSAQLPTDAKQGALISLGGGPTSDVFGGGIKYYANGHTNPNNPGTGNQHVFYTRSGVDTYTERFRISEDGQLLLGETVPFDSNVAIQFRKDNAGNQSRFIFRNRGNNGSSRVRLILSTLNRAANGDIFSGIEQYQSGGMAIFNGQSDTSHCNISFFAGNWQPITLKNGNVSGGDAIHCRAYWGTSNGIQMEVGGPQSGTHKSIRFQTSHYGGERGYIGVTLGGTSYNSSSDYRMKQDVVDLTGAIDRVKSFKPRRFKWKEDPTYTVDGFLAHEASTVVPESVDGEKDAVDSEGDPKYQVMDNSRLVPVLTAALKEAIAKIETLETKVAALEGS